MNQTPTPEHAAQDQSQVQYRRRRKALSLLSLALFVGLLCLVGFLVGKPLLELAGDPEQFRDWIDSKGLLGRVIYLGIRILQVVVTPLPGEVIEIGAGYAFGAVEGTLLCLLGSTLGGALVFFLTRRWGVKLVEVFISREKIAQLKFIRQEKRLHLVVFLIFFIPGSPKDVLTYFIGLTPIRFPAFLVLSTIGRVPSVITSVVGGHAISQQNYATAVWVFAITGVVSLGGMLLYHKILKLRGEHAQKVHEGQQLASGSPLPSPVRPQESSAEGPIAPQTESEATQQAEPSSTFCAPKE